MLSLFKENALPLNRTDAMIQARRILVLALNKGMVPSWDQYFQELPVLSEAEDLEAIKNYFENLTQWSFLEELLNQEATEFFFHSVEKL